MGLKRFLNKWSFRSSGHIQRRPVQSVLFLLIIVTVCLMPYFIGYRRRLETGGGGNGEPVIRVDGGELSASQYMARFKNVQSGPIVKPVPGVEFVPESKIDKTKTETEQKCVIPTLDLEDPVMLKFMKTPEPIQCPDGGVEDWATVQNGTLVFSKTAIQKFGKFTCDLHPFYRLDGNDNQIRWGDWQRGVSDGYKLKDDYFKIECKPTTTHPEKNRQKFSQIRHAVSDNPDIFTRMEHFRKMNPNIAKDRPTVLVLGFDSMSRMSWLRRLKKTREFFVNKLGGLELQGYNIMGDGTPAALFPMLTGKHEPELPEARRNFKGAKPIDGFPWVWKDFAKAGYITSWGDAEFNIAPFNMRLLGFRNSPTDYYWRPYYAGVNREKQHKGCQGSIPKHVDWFNRARDLFHKYGDYPKFIFHFYQSLSHEDANDIMLADEDLLHLLQHLNTKGYFKNTIVVLMGDHGSRFSSVRGTWPGKLEERLPYMGFSFPQSFQQNHPEAITNFKKNIHRLSTPLDIHETLLDVINFRGTSKGDVRNRAISLFKEIPLERSCAHANISNHWCACLEWQKVNPTDPTMLRAAKAVVDFINSLTSSYREFCSNLALDSVSFSLKLSSNKEFLAFKNSKDIHGLVPVFAEQKLQSREDLYQVTIHTSPGGGHFEATVSHRVVDDTMTVVEKEISRINKYGDAPWCVMDKNRQLRQYCYCSQQKDKPAS